MGKVARFPYRPRIVRDPLPERLKLSDEEIEQLGERFRAAGLHRLTSFARFVAMDEERRQVMERSHRHVERARLGGRIGGAA